jgi:hypothetical protein
LQPWERPNPMAAGSAKALGNPLRHIFASMVLSFQPPWPFGGSRVGLRHSLPVPSRDRHVLSDKMLNQRESKIFARFRNSSSSMISSLDAEASDKDNNRSRNDGWNRKSSTPIDEDAVFVEHLKGYDEESAMTEDKKVLGETVRTGQDFVSETMNNDA